MTESWFAGAGEGRLSTGGWEEGSWLVAQLRDLKVASQTTDSPGAQDTGGGIWGAAQGERREESE